MNGFLQVIILTLQGINLIVVFGIPIYRMYKGGKLFPNILLCWGLSILWAITWCFVLPVISLRFSKEIFLLFPEVIGVAAMIMFGWFPSITVCSIAYIIINPDRNKIKSITPKKSTEQTL